MKEIVIIFCCVLFLSCKTQKISLSPFVVVYKSDWIGHIPPEYISLKMQSEVFEIYSPGIYSSTVGKWNIKNDTLFLLPKYEYFSRDSELKFSEIMPKDTTVTTISKQYLIKNDCLIDITDYSIILPKLFSRKSEKNIYQRVKNR